MSKPYTHTRLTPPTESTVVFRLLTLKPGSVDDDIHIEIHEHKYRIQPHGQELDLEEAGLGMWWALSYTWGDPNILGTIYVDALSSPADEETEAASSYLEVTINLVDALKHLRGDEDRRFWIDAICIDQGTDDGALKERAWQVRSMHHIYRLAFGVVVWLGESEDGRFITDSLSELGRSFNVDWTTFELITTDGNYTPSMLKWTDHQAPERDRKGLVALLERPWFGRVWIRQEAFFARVEKSAILCGGALMPFSAFRNALHYLSIIDVVPGKHAPRLSMALSVFQSGYADAPNLLRNLRVADCKDPKDKIYGIMGILSGTSPQFMESININVDYSASTTLEQVYECFFLEYTRYFGTLRLLEEGGLWQRSPMRPTWVPDWQAKGEGFQLDLSMESATPQFIRADYDPPVDGVLSVVGCLANVVDYVYSWDESESGWDRVLLRNIRDHLCEASKDQVVTRLTSALCVILLGWRQTLSEQEQLKEEIKVWIAYLYDISKLDGPDQKLKPARDLISDEAAYALNLSLSQLQTRHKSLIFAGKSYVGIGPSITAPGDELWAVVGSRALMILRKRGADRHEVVGPCYVHGYNAGEALLGRMPSNYTTVLRQDVRGNYSPHFLDSTSGKVTMWDPRIDWREVEVHPPMTNISGYLIAAPKGEPIRLKPDIAFLKRQGVLLQPLHLV